MQRMPYQPMAPGQPISHMDNKTTPAVHQPQQQQYVQQAVSGKGIQKWCHLIL